MAVEDEIRGGAVIEPKTRIYPDQVCEDIFFFVIVESVQMPVPLLLHSFLLTFASSFLTPVPPATVMIFFFLVCCIPSSVVPPVISVTGQSYRLQSSFNVILCRSSGVHFFAPAPKVKSKFLSFLALVGICRVSLP